MTKEELNKKQTEEVQGGKHVLKDDDRSLASAKVVKASGH